LRFSIPPYAFLLTRDEWVAWNAPGESWASVSRGFSPSAEEIRKVLVGLRRDLRWSRSTLAAILGVPRDSLRRWETGARNPSGAARRLIWLIHLLASQPEKMRDGFDFIFWGKTDELRESTLVPFA